VRLDGCVTPVRSVKASAPPHRAATRCNMAGRVLIVPSSQADSCAQTVRAFLYPIRPRVHAVQVKLARPDGVVCNTALWTVGNHELSGIAEEIAAWISTEADEPKDMETAITVWDRRVDDTSS
jgi:hypothetical protein